MAEKATVPSADEGGRLKFGRNNAFQAELRKRCEEFFRTTGQRQQDCPQMYLKSAIILACFVSSYILLVFVAQTWWQALPLAVALGLSMAGIGFNIQHDAGHQAYSRFAPINKAMSMTLDLIGGSSYLWHWKHGVFHHTYVNIAGYDSDIELGILGRLAPHQKRYSFHRWQHLYLWPLYGMMAIKWQFYDDFRDVLLGKVGQLPVPRPKGWDLAVFLGGKILFFGFAFGIPLLLHPWTEVLIYYVVTGFVLGIVLSVVFQLAHTVEQAEFAMPQPDSLRIEKAWAIHQTHSTVDFARRSRLASWLLGGLNFQIEHHLLPRICHVHYPALAPIVEKTCRDYGVRYAAHSSFWAGLVSHYRWLRDLGKPNASGT